MKRIKRWLQDPVWGITTVVGTKYAWWPIRRKLLDRLQYWHIRQQNKLDKICINHWHIDYKPQPIIDYTETKIPNWMIYDDWRTK